MEQTKIDAGWKVCEQCEEEFYPFSSPKQRFCGRNCACTYNAYKQHNSK